MDRILNIILTGPPRIGKTTIIQTVLSRTDKECAGFYTEEIREGNQRVGFRLVTLNNSNCIMAHKKVKGKYKIGKYGVNLDCIEEIGVKAIIEGIARQKLIIIDEIGKMELFSRRFKNIVVDALDSNSFVLGTILFRHHPYCDMIKRRRDVKLIEVTKSNRNSLIDTIISKISK